MSDLTASEYQRIAKICRTIARSRRHLFTLCPELCVDDLAQIGIQRILIAQQRHPTMPLGSRPDGWYASCAIRALLDLLDTRTQRLKHYTAYAENTRYVASKLGGGANEIKFFPDSQKQKHPRYYPMNALANMMSYRIDRQVGWHSLGRQLRQDPFLYQELGFDRCPSVRGLIYAVQRMERRLAVNRLKRQFRNNR